MEPSRFWARVLAWLMPAEHRDAAAGDAAEEYALRWARDGERAARRWYRRQVMRSIPAAAARSLSGATHLMVSGASGGEVVSMWMNDLRLAARTLLRRPGFSGTIVVTLALGIGATTALFGVFRSVFLAPMDLPESDRLAFVMETAGFGCCGPASGPDYVDWVERNRSFDGMAALNPGSFNLAAEEGAEQVYGTRVTSNAFEFLGVEPLLGRSLLPEDEVTGGVVVLGHGLWQRLFAGDPDAVGATMEIDGSPTTVVGVMPAEFDVPSPWARTRGHAFFLPFERERLETNRGNHGTPVVAKLADGVDLDAAAADMDRIMRELAVEYPTTNGERGARVFSAHEYLYGDVGQQLGMILAAAALVLLIACGNVAGLQLARAAGRESELAVRAALGASRRAVAGLLFAESLLLSVVGGMGGVALAFVFTDALRGILPPTMPRADQVGIDGWSMLFAMTAAALTALIFGVLPALLGSRSDLAAGVKEGGYSLLAPRKERLRDYFIVGQIALGLVLANGAGLLVRSYMELTGQEYGFEAEGTLTMSLRAAGPRYEEIEARHAFYEQVAERVEALPGVGAAGVVTKLPLAGGSNANARVEGQPPPASTDEGPLVEVSGVAGRYFEAMGIPLIRGRTLASADTIQGAIGVVVNQALAEELWPEQDPLGRRFGFGMGLDEEEDPWFTVVGVVGNVRQWSAERPPIAEAYFPYARGWGGAGYVVMRATGDPATLTADARAAIASVDPTQPPSDVLAMSDRMDLAFAQRRFYTTLIALFAFSALFLAAAGIYGTVSYFVARRVRELGIRMALGAGGTGIVGLVLRRGVRLAIWGVLLGVVGAVASTSVVESLVYGVAARNVLSLLVGALLLVAVTLAASALPALRAIRVPPVLALRSE